MDITARGADWPNVRRGLGGDGHHAPSGEAAIPATDRSQLIAIGPELQRVCAIASSSASCRGSAISLVANKTCLVPEHWVAPLALIVNAALLNAARHAHPSGVDGKIEIGCTQNSGGQILIEITDDGVGLPEGFDPAKDGGHGLHLIRQLSSQLGATLSFESTCLGLSVQLLLPRPATGIGVEATAINAHGNEEIATAEAEQLMRDRRQHAGGHFRAQARRGDGGPASRRAVGAVPVYRQAVPGRLAR